MDAKIAESKLIRDLYYKSNHYMGYLMDFYEAYEKNSCFPPGHYYSSIVDLEEVRLFATSIFDKKKDVPGVNLNEDEQVVLLKKFELLSDTIPFPLEKNDDFRYFFNNQVFGYTDAIILFCFLITFKPKQVIEIGSGYSSALMLDTNSKFMGHSIKLDFIDPNPERLFELIFKEDKKACAIYHKKVQEMDFSFFDKLERNDILFIDGSHVSKTGSDLNYLLFEILPRLKDGVIVHFHDIFTGFEYPTDWVYEGRNWNECYVLKAFLNYNSKFKILMFNDFMHNFHKESFAKLPLCYKNFGGSIWLRKGE